LPSFDLLTLIFEEVDLAISQKGMGARTPINRHHLRSLYSPVDPINLFVPTSPHKLITEKPLLVEGQDHAPVSSQRSSMLLYSQYAHPRLTSPPNIAPETCRDIEAYD
jgi:hypothetical protein